LKVVFIIYIQEEKAENQIFGSGFFSHKGIPVNQKKEGSKSASSYKFTVYSWVSIAIRLLPSRARVLFLTHENKSISNNWNKGNLFSKKIISEKFGLQHRSSQNVFQIPNYSLIRLLIRE